MSDIDEKRDELLIVAVPYLHAIGSQLNGFIEAADKELAQHIAQNLEDIESYEQTIATKDAELARLREALSEAKRSLTRGIIIPKDIADSIDKALKSNDS